MGKRRAKKELTIEEIKAIYVEDVRRAEQIAPQTYTAKKKADANRHKAMRGTHEAKSKRWGEYQKFIDVLSGKFPPSSFDNFTRIAARHFDVRKKTIWRHTTNPHNRRTSV